MGHKTRDSRSPVAQRQAPFLADLFFFSSPRILNTSAFILVLVLIPHLPCPPTDQTPFTNNCIRLLSTHLTVNRRGKRADDVVRQRTDDTGPNNSNRHDGDGSIVQVQVVSLLMISYRYSTIFAFISITLLSNLIVRHRSLTEWQRRLRRDEHRDEEQYTCV
ncbi:hypothetical protein FRC18_000992 [Serendipita sp. 400]|nr:hypothetical protein FRC18_000992 [Serendipita sp. 400]